MVPDVAPKFIAVAPVNPLPLTVTRVPPAIGADEGVTAANAGPCTRLATSPGLGQTFGQNVYVGAVGGCAAPSIERKRFITLGAPALSGSRSAACDLCEMTRPDPPRRPTRRNSERVGVDPAPLEADGRLSDGRTIPVNELLVPQVVFTDTGTVPLPSGGTTTIVSGGQVVHCGAWFTLWTLPATVPNNTCEPSMKLDPVTVTGWPGGALDGLTPVTVGVPKVVTVTNRPFGVFDDVASLLKSSLGAALVGFVPIWNVTGLSGGIPLLKPRT